MFGMELGATWVSANLVTFVTYTFFLAPLMGKLITKLCLLAGLNPPVGVAKSVDYFIHACGVGHLGMIVWMAIAPTLFLVALVQVVLEVMTAVFTVRSCVLVHRYLKVLDEQE